MANYDLTVGVAATEGGPIATVLADTDPYKYLTQVVKTFTAEATNSNDSVYFVIP